MNRRLVFAIAACVGLSFWGNSCSKNINPVESKNDHGSANVTIRVGKVGALAKKTDIELDKLYLTLSAPGEVTLYDTFALSGNDQQSIVKTYSNLASLLKTWTLHAESHDAHGIVIHSGDTSFIVPARSTIAIALNLTANFSILQANFLGIKDSITGCELWIGDSKIADSSFPKQSLLGSNLRLTFNYLRTGLPQTIKMKVRGIMWGIEDLIYYGDTTITPTAGANLNFKILLNFVGPALPVPGEATMTVIIGEVGSVIVNGIFEETGDSFNDEFSTETLDSAWTIADYTPGHGEITQSQNPGFLRYNLIGSRSNFEGWRGTIRDGWSPSLSVIRAFSGGKWELSTKISYNLHERIGENSTGAQMPNLFIVFGNGNNNYIQVRRYVDYWYSFNGLHVLLTNSSGVPESSASDNLIATGDIDNNEWLASTYFYKIIRNNDSVDCFISQDSINFTKNLSFKLPKSTENTQRIILDETLWDAVGSYEDVDYFRVKIN